jgi:cytoskeleton protein RodZ
MNEPSPIILSAPDAGSRSAGDILRAAREAQGVTLERLATTIKVAPAKLEDLEQGRYDRLPDPNFTRALAMTICRALKIEPAEVLAALPAAKAIPLVSDRPPLNQPFKESKGGSPLFDKQVDLASALSLKWLAPALLLIAALVIYALPDSVDVPGWVHRMLQAPAHPVEVAVNKPPVAAPEPASAPMDEASGPVADLPAPVMDAPAPADTVPAPAAQASAVASAAAVVPAPSPSAPLQPGAGKPGAQTLVLDAATPAATAYVDPRLAKSSAPALAAATSAAVGASASAAVAMSVGPVGSMVLEAQQASWVEVKDAKGNKLISRQIQPGERVPLEGAVPLKLIIGNAPGMHLSFNGQGVDLARYTQSNVARLELK